MKILNNLEQLVVVSSSLILDHFLEVLHLFPC